jgi:PKD repeat protein
MNGVLEIQHHLQILQLLQIPRIRITNTGTYTVNLTVTTNSNCEQSITKIINVYPVPTAAFAIGTSCQNDSTAFLNQSTGITGYSITNSYWNFGDASPSATTSITSPKHVFTNATIYTVKLLVTNTAGCKDSVYKPVTVNNQVKANFTNGPACLNNSTLFQSTSIIPPSGSATYSWAFPGSTATVANPIKTFTNSGVYNVTLIVDGNNGCTSSITKLLNVYLPPIASFSIPSFCAKDTVNVINLSNPQSGIISSYNWRLNNNTFSTAQSPTLSLTNPGNNSVRLTIINSFGCKDSTTNSLTIFPLPVVDFSTTPVAFYYLNEPINFTPSITNATSYLWNMNGASTYSIQSPTETFNAEGTFSVNLNLKDQNGCKGSKIKNITVNKRYLDLAILNVSTTKDNDGFMTVVTDIANYGSVPISSFKMGYQISDGGNIKETWNGTLNPNSFYTFTFNAVSASTQNSENNITCVEIENVNTTIDDNTANNALCSSFNSDNINVSNPLPNPTNGDIILPITLNRDLDYTITIYNSVGQIQYEETTKKGLEGLNFVTLNTSSYAHGYYIIKTMIDGNIFIKKFIKISYE